MQITGVEEIWGIGRKLAQSLNQMGVNTVYDLKIANQKQMSSMFSVNVERIVLELNKVKCIELEEYQDARKQIISSRSFGSPVNSREVLHAAFTHFVDEVCKKLRSQKSFTRDITFYAKSSRFQDNYMSNSIKIELPHAMDSFRYLNKYIERALDSIYKPNIQYKKGGVIVSKIVDSDEQKDDLFDTVNIKHDKLLPTLESIKHHYGSGAITLASSKLSKKWGMQRNLKSKNYTTDASELLVVR